MSSPHRPAKPDIEMLPAAMAADQQLVDELTNLVNQVYAAAEEGLWVNGATRCTAVEIQNMIADDEIAVARAAQDRDLVASAKKRRVIGCVRIQQLDDDTGEFGMLVAHPDHRSEGIGRELVNFAEDLSRRRGLPIMQLELLVPRDWSHPTKEFLHAWYTRIGYTPVRTGNIEDAYPRLAPLLATPCDFVVYHKPLDA